MATIPSITQQEYTQPRKISDLKNPRGQASKRPTSVVVAPAASSNRVRNSYLTLDTFSPVNQNGSFEFDRIIKSGEVQKRTRKTKTWKSIFLVLRPHTLSIYKSEKEDKLKHKIHLCELTAVALLKDPKNKRRHIFGLFTPSRSFHLEANSRKDREEWVDLIRKEARIEEEEEEMLLASPIGNSNFSHGLEKATLSQKEQNRLHDERVGSSSPEPNDPIPRIRKSEAAVSMNKRRVSYTLDYSGNEMASYSDWSDTEISRTRGPSSGSALEEDSFAVKNPFPSSCGARNLSQMSGFNIEQDPERVVWQGYLLCLRSKRGVRQWKDWWVVIRPRNITIYKNDSEYSPTLIINFSTVVNAVEIDPVSKTKRLCLQIITEEKTFKFCAHSEDSLNKSLGAIKSLLARRREARNM